MARLSHLLAQVVRSPRLNSQYAVMMGALIAAAEPAALREAHKVKTGLLVDEADGNWCGPGAVMGGNP